MLNLDNCQLSSQIKFDQFVFLRYLSLSNTILYKETLCTEKKIFPKSLETLALEKNKLVDQELNTIFKLNPELPNLHRLYLSHNDLKLAPYSFNSKTNSNQKHSFEAFIEQSKNLNIDLSFNCVPSQKKEQLLSGKGE